MPADAAAAPIGDDVEDDDGHDLPVDPGHLVALRRARRRRRVAEVHWVDALYRVYMAGLLGVVAVVVIAGTVGDEPLTSGQVTDVTTHGPAVIGLVAALAVAVGLRSGSRGGPLAVEPGDVRHILLAPVDRARALRGPALRQVRSGLFIAVLLGAAAGRFADHRLPEPVAAWIAAGALAAATLVALSLGAALVASGRRLPRLATTAVAVVLVGWSALDVARVEVGGMPIPASPGRAVGWLALAPLDLHIAALAALVLAVVLVVAGLVGIGGLSVEAAERRTALVGQIRFAATLQDVRTVLVLRRQLAADRPRTRPWIGVGRGPARFPAWRRGWNGVLRFPAVRLGRLLLLAVAAGAALRGAWSGTAPLVVLAGLALWVGALDMVEPVAEEVDLPGRREGYPVPEGSLYVRLLSVPLVVATGLGLIAGLVAVAPGGGRVPALAGLVAGVVTALAACAGALGTVVSGAPSGGDELGLIAPEVAGMRLVLRAAWPVVLAILGALPLLVVEADLHAGRPAAGTASILWAVVAGLGLLAIGWVHQRQAIQEWWRQAMEAAGQGPAAARSEGADDDDDDDEDEEERER